MTPKISKNEKDIYKLASELIDQIDDLEQLRKERVSDAIPELDKSLAKLEEYVQYRKLGNLIWFQLQGLRTDRTRMWKTRCEEIAPEEISQLVLH